VVEQFNALVKEKMKAGDTRQAAVRAVSKSNRELHQAFVTATKDAYVEHREAALRA
jgi:hypothetical protein